MIVLVDHNLGGHAEILLGNIASQGWLELLPIRFVTFKEMNLPIDSNDRVVWRIAQAKKSEFHLTDNSYKFIPVASDVDISVSQAYPNKPAVPEYYQTHYYALQ